MKEYIHQEFIAEASRRGMESPKEYMTIDIVKASLGMGVKMKSMNNIKNRNPLRSVSFFSDSDVTKTRHLHLSEVSNTMPDQCEDWWVRIYNRGNEQQFETLNELFAIWRDRHVQEEDSQENYTLKRRRTFTFPSKQGRYFSSTDLADSGLM